MDCQAYCELLTLMSASELQREQMPDGARVFAGAFKRADLVVPAEDMQDGAAVGLRILQGCLFHPEGMTLLHDAGLRAKFNKAQHVALRKVKESLGVAATGWSFGLAYLQEVGVLCPSPKDSSALLLSPWSMDVEDALRKLGLSEIGIAELK